MVAVVGRAVDKGGQEVQAAKAAGWEVKVEVRWVAGMEGEEWVDPASWEEAVVAVGCLWSVRALAVVLNLKAHCLAVLSMEEGCAVAD
jgi:hypothetical protein